MAYSREELVQQLAAVTASQDDVRLPYHLIDDILNDVQRQFGADAISGVVDEALAIVERTDMAAMPRAEEL